MQEWVRRREAGESLRAIAADYEVTTQAGGAVAGDPSGDDVAVGRTVRSGGLLEVLTGDEGVSGAEIAGLFDTIAADVHEFVGWPVDPSRCLYCGETRGAPGHPRRCLGCGSADLARIVRGLPAPGYDRNPPPDVWFGGCDIEPFGANVRCASCGTKLCDEDGTLKLPDEFEPATYGGTPGCRRHSGMH